MAHSNSSFPQRRNMILPFVAFASKKCSSSPIARTDDWMLDGQHSDCRKPPIRVRLRSAAQELRYIPCLRRPTPGSLTPTSHAQASAQESHGVSRNSRAMSRPLILIVGDDTNLSFLAVSSESTSILRVVTSVPEAWRTSRTVRSAVSRLASVLLHRVQTSRSRYRNSISICFSLPVFEAPIVYASLGNSLH